jgi:hypothetical protein
VSEHGHELRRGLTSAGQQAAVTIPFTDNEVTAEP